MDDSSDSSSTEWPAVVERLDRLESLLVELCGQEEDENIYKLAWAFLSGKELCLCQGVSKQWKSLVSLPSTWLEACHSRRLTGERANFMAAQFSLRARKACDAEVKQVEAAKRALASAPGAAFVDLRDGLAASARGAAAPPPATVAAVLDASVSIIKGYVKGSPSVWRAALDGDVLKTREKAPLGGNNTYYFTAKKPLLKKDKLVSALRKIDLFEAFSNFENQKLFRHTVLQDRFPLPSEVSQHNLLVGRLCAFCHATSALFLKLDELAVDAPSTADALLVADLADTFARKHIADLKEDNCRAATQPAVLAGRSFGAKERRRRSVSARPSSKSAPPSPATLYDIFVDERTEKKVVSSSSKAYGAKYYRDVLRQFYEKHNPSLAPKADAIAREWRGRESTLFALLRYKYADKARATTYAPPPQADFATTPPPRVREDDLVSVASADGYGSKRRHDDKKKTNTPMSSSWRRRSVTAPRGPSTKTSKRRASLQPDLRSEIDKLKSDVEAARTAQDRAKARAIAAQRDAKSANLARHQDRQRAEELKAESAALRAERDRGKHQLARLKKQLEDNDKKGRSEKKQKPPLTEQTKRHQQGSLLENNSFLENNEETDLAVSAVESAVIDVLLTEATIEIDFELSFGPFPDLDERLSKTTPSPIKEEESPDDDNIDFPPRATSPSRTMPLVPLTDVTS